jgi:hypothetical protein
VTGAKPELGHTRIQLLCWAETLFVSSVRFNPKRQILPEATDISEGHKSMTVHLINPSDISFGTAVITPRWVYVLTAATPPSFGDPNIVDETLEQINAACILPGDVVGIGIHTGNALRGYDIGRIAREKGAWVVFGGILLCQRKRYCAGKRTSVCERGSWRASL